MSLPGNCVCMSGLNDMLGMVYHLASSPSLSGDQVMEFQLIDTKAKSMLARGPMCLPPKATLEWFAVLPSAMLACLDSEGYASVFSSASMGGQWMPVLDIKVHNQTRDWFWPIGLTNQDLLGVRCKIEKRYPDVLRPVVTKFQLQVPLCKGDEGEEKYMRGRIYFAHDEASAKPGDEEEEEELAGRALDLDKGLLQLINAALEQEKLMR